MRFGFAMRAAWSRVMIVDMLLLQAVLATSDRLSDFRAKLDAAVAHSAPLTPALRILATAVDAECRTQADADALVRRWSRSRLANTPEIGAQLASGTRRRYVAVRIGRIGGVFAFDAAHRELPIPKALQTIDGYAPRVHVTSLGDFVAEESIQAAGMRFGWRLHRIVDARTDEALGSGGWNLDDKPETWLRIDAKSITTHALADTKVFLVSSAQRLVVTDRTWAPRNGRWSLVATNANPQAILDIDAWASEALRAKKPNALQTRFRAAFGNQPDMIQSYAATAVAKNRWRVTINRLVFDVQDHRVVGLAVKG